MGKSLAASTRIHNLAKHLKPSKHAKPTSRTERPGEDKSKKMESSASIDNINYGSSNGNSSTRLPLSEVVSDCVKRWFKDTLKEAKAGDINMQVLVGQMYYSGYGIPRDAQKVNLNGFLMGLSCSFFSPNLIDFWMVLVCYY